MVQKSILDFYNLIFEKYPLIPKSDIKRILQYGMKVFEGYNFSGADVLVKNNYFWLYSGKMMKNSLKYFNYYKLKIIAKMRIMYVKKRIPYDGYYYFGLNRNHYQKYLDSKKTKGRPKKWFTFEKVFFYKIYDECCIKESNAIAIFRVPFIIPKGFTRYEPIFKTDKAELVLIREEPLKFKDVLASEYNYQFLINK